MSITLLKASLRQYWIICSLIAFLMLLHIIILPFSPPGFFVDEAATGSHVISMLKEGTNAQGEAWPLFSASLGDGYTTPTYLYPLVGWSALFGISELSLRYFSLFVTFITLFVLALGIRYWLGAKGAFISMLAGLALPWAWLQGSLAWDPAIVPLFVTSSFALFSALFWSRSTKVFWFSVISLPVILVLLAYAYPPCRVSAPLLFAGAYVLLYFKKKLSIKHCLLSIFIAALVALPLALFMFQPEALARSSALSVFYSTSLIEGIGKLCVNIVLLVNPFFLFVTGDPNIRHATGVQGMLGLAAIPPLIALIYTVLQARKTHKDPLANTYLLVIITFAGVIISLLGSALTNEGQPHSLRATAAWPFWAMLITIGWYYLYTLYSRRLFNGLIIFCAISTLAYTFDFTYEYPRRAAEAFDVPTRNTIDRGEPIDYPDLGQRYYQTK